MSIYVATLLCLLLLLLIQTLLHYKERRDLYNRLMSRDVYEYKKLNEETDTEADEYAEKKKTNNPLYNSIRRNYRNMYGNDK